MEVVVILVPVLIALGIGLFAQYRVSRARLKEQQMWEEYSRTIKVPPLKTPSAVALGQNPKVRGTPEQRAARRRQAIRHHVKRRPKPSHLQVPDGLYWDELLDEFCYLSEEWAYRRDLEAHAAELREHARHLERQADHDTHSFRRTRLNHEDTLSPNHYVNLSNPFTFDTSSSTDDVKTTHGGGGSFGGGGSSGSWDTPDSKDTCSYDSGGGYDGGGDCGGGGGGGD